MAKALVNSLAAQWDPAKYADDQLSARSDVYAVS